MSGPEGWRQAWEGPPPGGCAPGGDTGGDTEEGQTCGKGRAGGARALLPMGTQDWDQDDRCRSPRGHAGEAQVCPRMARGQRCWQGEDTGPSGALLVCGELPRGSIPGPALQDLCICSARALPAPPAAKHPSPAPPPRQPSAPRASFIPTLLRLCCSPASHSVPRLTRSHLQGPGEPSSPL